MARTNSRQVWRCEASTLAPTGVNQIVINHLEIHMQGPPHHLEFDDTGTIHVEFVMIRPGEYPWYIQGMESRGMTGRFIVK